MRSTVERGAVEKRAVGALAVTMMAALSILVLPAPSFAAAPSGVNFRGSAVRDLGKDTGAPEVIGSGGAAAERITREPGSPTPSATVTTEQDTNGQDTAPGGQTNRVGGSDPAPAPGKPGWVWWVTGAFVVMLGAGGFRLWRSTLEPHATQQPSDDGKSEPDDPSDPGASSEPQDD